MSDSKITRFSNKYKEVWPIVLSILSIIVTMITTFMMGSPEKRLSDLKKNINVEIEYIEGHFKPNSTFSDSILSPDAQMVKDFQISTLKTIEYWKSLNDQQFVKDAKTYSTEELLNIMLEYFSCLGGFDHEVYNVLTAVDTLTRYGKTHDIQSFIPDSKSTSTLLKKAKDRQLVAKKVNEQSMNNILTLMIEYGNAPENIHNKEITKALKPCEKMYNSKESLEFTSEFYSYCIALNIMYIYSINQTAK